jgi:hypothetical protein
MSDVVTAAAPSTAPVWVALARRPTAVAVAIAFYMAAALALAVSGWSDAAVAFRDTDDAMRLQQVRDLLAGQGWFDLHHWRLDPGHDVVMHWSRLVDLPLALLISALSFVTSQATAEKIAVLAWPPVTGIFFFAGLMRVMRRFAGAQHELSVALAPVLCLPILQQFVPGRIDHHGIQLACAMWVVALSLEANVQAAFRAGLIAALGLAVGLEGLIVVVFAGIGVAALLLIDRGAAPRARAFAMGLGGATVGLHLVLAGPNWAASSCDAIGLNWVILIALACAGVLAASRIAQHSSAGLAGPLVALGAFGAVAVIAFTALDRACLAGPFGDIDARIRPIWLDLVTEVQPAMTLFHDKPSLVTLRFLALLPLGLAGLVIVARHRRLWNPLLLAYGAALPLAMVLAALQLRAATYMILLAIPFAAIALPAVARRASVLGIRPQIAGAALLALMLITALGAGKAAQALMRSPHGSAASTDGSPGWASCMRTDAYSDLARLPPGVVAAPVDLGPVLLLATPHRVLAAPYHRFGRGIVDAHAILSHSPEHAAPEIADRGVTYVVTCPGSMPWGALDAALRAGRPPAWLEPVGSSGSVLVYRVLPH